MLTIAALAAVVAVVPIACGHDAAPSSGTVKDKKFEGTQTTNMPFCKEAPKDGGICTIWTVQPVQQGEHYLLLINDGHREGWVEVPKEVYDRVYVGDPWPERRTTGTTPTTTMTAPADPAPGTR